MITIHPATTKDAKQIAEIKNITWKDTYKEIVDLSYLRKLKATEEVIEKWKNRIKNSKIDNTYLWVAHDHNKIVGFLWGGKARQPVVEKLNYEIYAFYVLPQYQNQGIGKKLFNTFINTVRDDFFLWMLKGNESELIYAKLKCRRTTYLNPIVIGDKQYQEIAFIYKTRKP